MTESTTNDQELILTYQSQLKLVEDTILQQEESSGQASAELRQLRSDLREALSLFNGSEEVISDPPVITLDESEAAPCFTLSSDSDSETDEDEDEDEIDPILKEISGTNCSVTIPCSATGLTRHNALVLGIESLNDRTVRVLFSQPTQIGFKACSHFLNDTCRFGEKCRYSHGHVVSVDDLLEYIEPTNQTFLVGQSVICQHGDEGLWKAGMIETVEPENQLCVIRFTHVKGLEAIPFGSILITNPSDSREENDDEEIHVNVEYPSDTTIDPSQSEEFGQWERHTRGIGSKLMAKMGYKTGQGLGRHNQGRVNPIEARILPKGKSLDAISALKKNNRLPNAFQIRRERKKKMKNSSSSSRTTTEEKNVFTFLDRVFTSEMRSGDTPTISSPLDRFKANEEPVTEASLLLHTEIGRHHDQLRQYEREIRQLEERLKFNQSTGASTVALNIRQRLAAKKLQYAKLQENERNLQSKREQIRTKKSDIF